MRTPDPATMGDVAYDAACSEFADAASAPISLSEAAGRWRTRDGCVLLIREMSIAHLASSVALFEANGWEDHPKIRELCEELARR
jgi:hypothetical protein